jgi:phage gp16-like protein
MNDPTRNRQLAAIHIGAQQLGLDDDAYRDLLWTVGRVRSARDLDAHGRAAVLDHLKSRGWKSKRLGRTTPPADRDALVRKVRAQLAAAGRPDAYGDGIARHMFGAERYEWLETDQLRRVVAALAYDAKRRGARVR